MAEWVLALEVTLFYRPPNVPTEQYLKSQNLWIMHKLLMSLDNGRVRERMQSLLNPPPPPPNSNNNNNSGNYNKNVRNALYGILKEAEYKTVNQHNVATGNILEELICKLTQFQKNYYNSLLEEKTAQVHRRCQMIRWCSMLIVNGNLQWLQKCPFEELLGQFQTWLNNEDGMHF